ncbi:hypothetical protein EGW08_012769 [Elysia chlorotica]|uniref:Uncharacterized protein n=1 Tax=Elysia chlorotica TaxID=188477 RepID=A0A3S1C0B1_ELYCH|nr:hypothetical protein EGW08_012769 [Elysia chlorotica]
MASDHNSFQMLCIFTNLVMVLAVSLLVTCSLALQYSFQEPLPGLLHHSLEEMSDAKPSPISPAPWLHVTWAVVMAWQLALALHALISVFRKWGGVPVYTSPVLLSVPVLMSVIAACGLSGGWFLLYDQNRTTTSCVLAGLAMVLAWMAFGFSLSSLEENLFRLSKAERYSEILLHRLIVHNGLALYAMWSMYVAACNVAVAMIHNEKHSVDKDLSTGVAMTMMAVFMVGYFLMDVTCLDRFTRYTGTPYMVSIFVLSACIFRQEDWKSDDVNFIFLACLLTLAFLFCMAKSACVLCRVMRPNKHGSIDVTSVSFRRAVPEDEGRYLLK